MKKTLLSLAVFVFCGFNVAQACVDFSGKYVGKTPDGWSVSQVIEQKGCESIRMTMQPLDDEESIAVVQDIVLDGKPHGFTQPGGLQAFRTTQFVGNSLVSKLETVLPNGQRMTSTSTVTLDSSGNLVEKMVTSDPLGRPHEVVMVFKRQ